MWSFFLQNLATTSLQLSFFYREATNSSTVPLQVLIIIISPDIDFTWLSSYFLNNTLAWYAVAWYFWVTQGGFYCRNSSFKLLIIIENSTRCTIIKCIASRCLIVKDISLNTLVNSFQMTAVAALTAFAQLLQCQYTGGHVRTRISSPGSGRHCRDRIDLFDESIWYLQTKMLTTLSL